MGPSREVAICRGPDWGEACLGSWGKGEGGLVVLFSVDFASCVVEERSGGEGRDEARLVVEGIPTAAAGWMMSSALLNEPSIGQEAGQGGRWDEAYIGRRQSGGRGATLQDPWGRGRGRADAEEGGRGEGEE